MSSTTAWRHIRKYQKRNNINQRQWHQKAAAINPRRANKRRRQLMAAHGVNKAAISVASLRQKKKINGNVSIETSAAKHSVKYRGL